MVPGYLVLRAAITRLCRLVQPVCLGGESTDSGYRDAFGVTGALNGLMDQTPYIHTPYTIPNIMQSVYIYIYYIYIHTAKERNKERHTKTQKNRQNEITNTTNTEMNNEWKK